MLKISPKTKIFVLDKNSDIFHITVQNIDCRYSLEPPRRGGSNEYPQSTFSSRNKKHNDTPVNPNFFCIKVGFKGSKLNRHVFMMNQNKIFSIKIKPKRKTSFRGMSKAQ